MDCPRDDETLIRYSQQTTILPPVSGLAGYHAPPMAHPLATTPPTPAAGAMQPHEIAATYHLQDIVQQFKSQPELLRLILTSKVEEDRRHTEEARLRARELEVYLQDATSVSPPPLVYAHHDTPPLSPHQHIRRASNASSVQSDACSQPPMSPNAATSPSSASPPATSHLLRHHIPILPCEHPLESVHNQHQRQRSIPPRKRRSMQAITKIVETKDPKYQDEYLWKNNGNTVQRKTGCKSTYYKCANAGKGCPVNKTVIYKPNGESVIKYRGTHLAMCSTVEHIRDTT
ncbi:hypothetical protein BC940DRAFT_301269 [Gongronella butleri]|nr:hypothetical protein BC940DRAFT_301269 [Gongronella butleri]